MRETGRAWGTGVMTLGVWKLRLLPTHPHAWIVRCARLIYHACFGTNIRLDPSAGGKMLLER